LRRHQSVDDELEDPAIGIEMQVRALWSALFPFEMNIASSIRRRVLGAIAGLRSPSEVVRGKRGTCTILR